MSKKNRQGKGVRARKSREFREFRAKQYLHRRLKELPPSLDSLPEKVKENRAGIVSGNALASKGGFVNATRPIATRLHEEKMKDSSLLKRHLNDK